MNRKKSIWVKPVATLLILGALLLILPNRALDPWGLFNASKLVTLIFALTLLQGLGVLFSHMPGVKAGALLTGLFGGIVSSTATTAALARQSRQTVSTSKNSAPIETLKFLSATAAMLIEGLAVLAIGATEIPHTVLLIFLGPLLATSVLIVMQSRRIDGAQINIADTEFRILPILSLTGFIIGILAISKVLQLSFGQSGLSTLTFLVSLFEIHGSLIANIQLFEAGEFKVQTLGNLMALSVAASYVSKLFLVYTLGSKGLAHRTAKLTALILLSLVLSWSILFL